MEILIELQGIYTTMSYEKLLKMSIVTEELIGDTYFIKTENMDFSCYAKEWHRFVRHKRLTQILDID